MCNNLRPGLSGALRRGGSGNGGRMKASKSTQ